MGLDRRKFVSATGAAIASLAVAGCMGDENGGGDQNGGGNGTNGDTGDDFTDLDGEAGDTPNYLKITSFNAYETSDNVGVFGVVKNVGDNPLDHLEVEVTLKDGDTVLGEVIDTAEKEIDYLQPGKQWRFNAVFDDENLSKATGFTVSADGEVVEEAGDGTANGTETNGTETTNSGG